MNAHVHVAVRCNQGCSGYKNICCNSSSKKIDLPKVMGSDGAIDGGTDVSTRSAVGNDVPMGTSTNGEKEDTGTIASEGASVTNDVGNKVADRYRDAI